MYRCEICDDCRGPGLPLLRHTIYRPALRGTLRIEAGHEIACEVPVCESCDDLLRAGTPLALMIEKRGKVRPRAKVSKNGDH